MEHKDKFQKKFSDFRHAVASRSPINKSKSNSILKASTVNKKSRPKDADKDKSRVLKKSINNIEQKHKTDVQPIIYPSIIRDLELQLSTLNSTLKHLPIGTVSEITNYYQIIKEFIKQMLTSPLYNVMKLLHSIYTIPLPTLISKNEFNSKIYTQQSQQSSQQLMNKSKSSTLQNFLQSSSSSTKLLTSNNSYVIQPQHIQPFIKKDLNSSINKIGLKLNMNKIQETKQNVKDYFDQFYDNIEQFSESWREQALREKR